MVTSPAAAEPDIEAIRSLIESARSAGLTALTEPDGLALLDAAGFATPRRVLVGGGAGGGPTPAGSLDAALAALPGNQVVVKAVVPEVLHKTEVGGVAVVARDAAAVETAIGGMRARLRALGLTPDGFLLAEYIDHDLALGGELLLSLRWTEDFGPVVSVGAGGIAAEALAPDLRPGREIAIVSSAVAPGLGAPPDPDAPDPLATLLRRATAVRLATSGLRGRPPRLRVERLVDAVRRLVAIGDALVPDDLLELEVNPAAVTPDGRLVALDVTVALGGGPRPPRPARPLHRLARLLEPRSIGIAGVSGASANPGRVILDNLVDEGFGRDRIVIVKPGADEIRGVRCVPDLAAMSEPVDLFVIALSAAQAPAFVEELIRLERAESVIVIPAGLEEKQGGAGLAGRIRRALDVARATPGGGPVVNGGNCLGIRSRPGGYDTLFIPRRRLPAGDRPAPLALITASGAFAVTRLSRLGRLDPRYVVTVGNQTDLTVADYLEHLADDAEVHVFAVYVEGFGRLEGRRFLQAAARIRSTGRTVILHRAGRTSEGARASASHTAAIAGDAVVARELARAAGVVDAESPGAFDDLVRVFTMLDGRAPRGRRLGALSNAGSECVTIADHAGSLELGPFSAATEARLAAILEPAGVSSVVDIHNPLDLTPAAGSGVYAAVARVVLDADETDVGLIGIVPITEALEVLPRGPGHDEDASRPDAIAARLARLWRESSKPWVASVDAGSLYAPFVDLLDAAGVPTLPTADAAVRALATYCDAMLGPDDAGGPAHG
jgi:acyl-CoA synthetase (NDP forming)